MSAPTPDLARAAQFLWGHARLLERRCFAHRFLGGEAEPVLTALRAYRNPDGGFGHALEPDLRSPQSQPGGVRAAFELLDELGAFADPMVLPACDFLERIATPEGGLPFAVLDATPYPHAPWLTPALAAQPSVTFTAPIAGLLHRHRVRHPWLDRATAYCWREVDRFDPPTFTGAWDIPRSAACYELRALLLFLEGLSGPRAEAAFERLGRILLERGLVALAPETPGETHFPTDYAASPDTRARRLFSDELLATHLDACVRAQDAEDGGWHFTFTAWNPAASLEWRGVVTLQALRLLQAYGRLPPRASGAPA